MNMKNDDRWSYVHGVVAGVIGTCLAITGLLEIASLIKGLIE